MDQKATEELKRQLAEFANSFAVEKRDHERLQEEVGMADGKIQALEQEVIHCTFTTELLFISTKFYLFIYLFIYIFILISKSELM